MLDGEGTIEENLLPGVTSPGMFDGKFLGMNYVYTVYALWFSRRVRGEGLDSSRDLGGPDGPR